MPSSTKLSACQNVGEGIVIRSNCELCSVQLIMEFIQNSPLECQELQLMNGIVVFRSTQFMTGIDNRSQSIWKFLIQHGA